MVNEIGVGLALGLGVVGGFVRGKWWLLDFRGGLVSRLLDVVMERG